MIKLKETIHQFYKFILIGILNTLIDLGVLNGLILLTAIASGWEFSLFKGISFAVAVTNSYFWNKFWTFKKEGGGVAPAPRSLGVVGEFGQFFIISAAGLGVNVGVASLLVNAVGPFGGVSPQIWANIGAVMAIGFSTIWNFVLYKFFVFRK